VQKKNKEPRFVAKTAKNKIDCEKREKKGRGRNDINPLRGTETFTSMNID
jgi:hypothetical protein